MTYTPEDIARFTGGHAKGNSGVTGVRPDRIEDAGPGSITFYNNSKYRDYLSNLNNCIVLVALDFAVELKETVAIVRVGDPMLSFSLVLSHFEIHQEGNKISSLAVVADNVKVGEEVWIAELAYIGSLSEIGNRSKIFPQVYIGNNVQIGSDCTFYPGARIYDNTIIGNRCILHAGVVIGSDGFGFVPLEDGTYSKIPQLGNVIIEDDVEIGANSTIDRAVTGSTIIRKGVKIDNLVMIGHNAEVGAFTVIAAQTGISGSTQLGEHCQVGGQVGFAGHLSIAPFSRINAQSGFAKSVKVPGKAWSGSPAREFQKHYRQLASMEKIPELEREIAAIKEILSLLESKNK